MKHCPVCNTEVEDLYTGLCPNTNCSWEFEFISEMTPELQMRYKEKMVRAIKIYNAIKVLQNSDLKNINSSTEKDSMSTKSIKKNCKKSDFVLSGSKSNNFPGAHIIGL